MTASDWNKLAPPGTPVAWLRCGEIVYTETVGAAFTDRAGIDAVEVKFTVHPVALAYLRLAGE